VGEGSISSLNRSARASRQILIKINSIIYNYILRIDSKKNTGLRKLKCGMWVITQKWKKLRKSVGDGSGKRDLPRIDVSYGRNDLWCGSPKARP
jgi:hypothetical protein